MLTDNFYTHLAMQLVGASTAGELFLAVGRGANQWDRTPPTLRRNLAQLHSEAMRVTVSEVAYLDAADTVSTTPTPVLRLHGAFARGTLSGTLRECGVINNEDALLAYFVHPRIELQPSDALDRYVRLDLRPGRSRVEEHITRYLGNSKSEEFHDLERETPGCQIGEIRIDRRHYFASIDAALALRYDYCARCFGTVLSER
ncbi:MAG: hypothetical protein H7Y02_03060 [Candidatus Obscuribacterales bacterium]|nr:hypothetical protein [Steroidobacteraceae bacterium]